MTTLYCARWVLPDSLTGVADGAIAINEERILGVGTRAALVTQFPQATVRDFGEAVIIPGLVNAHTHLELTAMRGFLEDEETNFLAWLKKLTMARLERLTGDDLNVSVAWGACEAVRSGVTCVADASDSAFESMSALRDVGIRGIVFQESFGPDVRLVHENLEKLKTKVSRLHEHETLLVKCGVSPHAPYTVCAPQLELISRFAIDEDLPLMMHAAETSMEVSLLSEGCGPFADGLRSRGIDWQAPRVSTIQYLNDHGVLRTRPLLAHCIHVNEADIEMMRQSGTRVAHCAKSNAKLGHGRAPFSDFLDKGIVVGLGSDSVASNNTCDLLEEARFALLLARANFNCEAGNVSDSSDHDGQEQRHLTAAEAFKTATLGGAHAVGVEDHVGELREGMQADFAVVALDGAHQIPSYDPISTLIFASSGRDVRLTVVAGREVYRDGRVMTVDEDRLRARMSEIVEKLRT
jgi:cytosine/adenosine deaminase-related metal-dependent hydrolase